MIQILGYPDINTADNRERIRACKEEYDLGLEPLARDEQKVFRDHVNDWYEKNKDMLEKWFEMYTQRNGK